VRRSVDPFAVYFDPVIPLSASAPVLVLKGCISQ
jgi:hypothetical protein